MNEPSDYNLLLKKFDNTCKELGEVESNYRVLRPCLGRFDTKFYIPYEQDPHILSFRNIHSQPFTNKYERDPQILSFRNIRSQPLTYKQLPKLNYSSESSESIHENDLQRNKVCLKSAVIAKERIPESRKDVIKKQNANQKVRKRNSRILGMLQSTLQKFQDDAVKRQPQDMKRIRLEQKIEAANEEEKRRVKRQTKELLLKMRKKQLQLDFITDMMTITESFEAWKCNMNMLLHFIITNTEPKICYLPASHNSVTKKRLAKSRSEMQESIGKQEAAFKVELAEIQDSYRTADFTMVEKTLRQLMTDHTIFPKREVCDKDVF